MGLELTLEKQAIIIIFMCLFIIAHMAFSIWSYLQLRNKKGPKGPRGLQGPAGAPG